MDGIGDVKSLARDHWYCGVCNTKNYEIWIKKSAEDTKRKDEEDRIAREKEEEKNRVLQNDTQRLKIEWVEEDQVVEVTFSNGDNYIGFLKDGMPHGHGCMSYSNSEKYTGKY